MAESTRTDAKGNVLFDRQGGTVLSPAHVLRWVHTPQQLYRRTLHVDVVAVEPLGMRHLKVWQGDVTFDALHDDDDDVAARRRCGVVRCPLEPPPVDPLRHQLLRRSRASAAQCRERASYNPRGRGRTEAEAEADADVDVDVDVDVVGAGVGGRVAADGEREHARHIVSGALRKPPCARPTSAHPNRPTGCSTAAAVRPSSALTAARPEAAVEEAATAHALYEEEEEEEDVLADASASSSDHEQEEVEAAGREAATAAARPTSATTRSSHDSTMAQLEQQRARMRERMEEMRRMMDR